MKIKSHLHIATKLTKLLDGQFEIGHVRFGIDPLLNFIPGIGNPVSFILSCYLVWIAKKIELPSNDVRTMKINIALDFALGFIPFLGNMADFALKANERNLKILKKYAYRDAIELQGPA